jgi:uncharacterized surface protein with fasciclin (FAS1) repeats
MTINRKEVYMRRWNSYTIKLVACFAIILIGCLFAYAAGFSPEKNIVDNLSTEGSFTTLIKALQAADLVATLKGAGPFTIFAPNDAAFARLPKGMLDDLLKPENKAKLASILTYHVMPGKYTVDELERIPRKQLDTVNGLQLIFTESNNIKAVDNGKLLQTDIACSNGLIHVIDTPVIPKPDEHQM